MTFDPDKINYNPRHFVSGSFVEDTESSFTFVRPSDQKKHC